MVKMKDEALAAVREIPNWIGGAETAVASNTFIKKNPHDGTPIFRVARSGAGEVGQAVRAAKAAQGPWADLFVAKRGELLTETALQLRKKREEVARIVALETGKSLKSALAETDGAVSLGLFFGGEGQRYYGRTIASSIAHRQVFTVRQPIGVAGLIVPANTPVANVAWKVFPALLCGNTAVLKAAEDAPGTAWLFARIAREAGLPEGVLSVVQGLGDEAGAALVEHPDVGVLSFTGSAATGRRVAVKAAERFCRVSLELGGKNPLVVCDDADLENAVSWTLLSAFGNAGQRCSAASRILVFDKVYEVFRKNLVDRTRALRVGVSDADDLGPLIREDHLERVLSAVERAANRGAKILTGGRRLTDSTHASGYYMEPTVMENVDPRDEISVDELFGPVTILYRVGNLEEAIALSNDSPYGLTSAIHTQNLNRAHEYARRVQAGVVSINAGTYGSEPHLPFGGLKQSGNGTREPGIEALDVYSELKNVYVNVDSSKV